MLDTKQAYGKKEGVQYYHVIQSFKPGEVTPELALEIAREFAEEHLPGFEAVIAVHVDREHIHAHTIFNSVNAETGRKYHSNARSYYSQIRATSDRLCREHGLSVIMEGASSKAVSYIEWLRQSKGQPTFRSMLEADLRTAIEDANDLGHFFMLMEHMGWEINHVRLGLDTHKHRRSLNVLVIGGSGAGKSRSYVKPNILEANTNYVVTDPKSEVLLATGGWLEQNGYDIRVLNLVNLEESDGYNPFRYIRDEKDALRLVNNLIQATTPKGNHGSDPFWNTSRKAPTSPSEWPSTAGWHRAAQTPPTASMRRKPTTFKRLMRIPIGNWPESMRAKGWSIPPRKSERSSAVCFPPVGGDASTSSSRNLCPASPGTRWSA